MSKLYTIEEVMERVNKSKSAIEKYQKSGFIEPTKVSNPKGKPLNRYTEEEVQRLENHLTERDTEPPVVVTAASTESLTEKNTEVNTEPITESGLAVPDVSSLAPQSNLTLIALTPDQFKALTSKEGEVPLADKPLLKISEAHQLTGIPEEKLRDATKKGELKGHKFGRGVQVRRVDLDAWIGTYFE